MSVVYVFSYYPDICQSSCHPINLFVVAALFRFCSVLTLSLPNVAKGKFRPHFQFTFSKILTNKQHHVKVQAVSFHLNGHIIGLCLQTQKLEPPYKTLSNNLAVKGLNKDAESKASTLGARDFSSTLSAREKNLWYPG